MACALLEYGRESGRRKAGEVGDFFQCEMPLNIFIKKVSYYIHYVITMRCLIIRIAILLDKTQ